MRARTNKSLNFSSIFVLFLLLLLTSLKIHSTKWIEHLFLLNWLTSLGFLLGITLGYSRFKTLLSSLFILLYSVIALPWAIGITYSSSINWVSRLESILGRILFTLRQLIDNTPISDPILFLSFLCIVIWFTALFAGYLLVRSSNPWFPIFISAITIFSAEIYYHQSNFLYTGFFIFFLLVLISRISLMDNSRNWRLRRIPIDLEAEPLIRKSSLIVAFVIVLLSWNITTIVSAFQKDSIENKQLIGFVAEIQSQFAKITAPIQGTAYIRTEFFGNTVELGTGSQLTEEVIFEISANQRKPSGIRYYWKGKSYDTFTNNKWESINDGEKLFETNENIPNVPDFATITKRTFSIKTFKNLGVLYAPLYPQKIDRPFKANYQNQLSNNIDITSLALDKITFSGEIYQVENIIINPTIAQLRKSTQDYPEWVTNKYLQLPFKFSEKVSNLSLELTENKTNPYDKVEEITNYLRENITYNEQIPSPPIDQDIVEWFLFELKEGFCNYYATTEVLMLRSIGIPARISFGYAQGEQLDSTGTEFLVRREQLHAWPEVYFQGIGWVIFEPTTIQPSIQRDPGESFENGNTVTPFPNLNRNDLPLLDGGENYPLNQETPEIVIQPILEEPEIVVEQDTNNSSIFWIIFLIFGILIGVGYAFRKPSRRIIDATPVVLENYLTRRGWRIPNWLQLWARYSLLPKEAKAFSKIILAVTLNNKSVQKSFTPSEIVAQFDEVFPELQEISAITLQEYQKALFSQEIIDLHLIQTNSKKMLLHALNHKLVSLFKFPKRFEKI